MAAFLWEGLATPRHTSGPVGKEGDANAEQAQVCLGWASTSITPDKPVQLMGQMFERISSGVHDPVTATALAIEAGGEQAILVSCDLALVPRQVHEGLRAALASRLAGFDTRKLILAATHTHTGPNMWDDWWHPAAREGVMGGAEYVQFLVPRLAEICVAAWERRQAAGVSWGLGQAVVGHNRRAVYADGRVLMYGPTDKPDFLGLEGGEDHGLELLYTWDARGELTGVLINIACPSQVVEGKGYLSADYWSEVRTQLRQRHGEGLFLLPLCSAAGDQSPHDLLRRVHGEVDLWDEPGLVEIGRRIANAVDEVLPQARRALKTSAVFRHTAKEITLPGLVVTREQADKSRAMIEALRKRPSHAPGSMEYGYARYQQALVERFERQPDKVEYRTELHALRLGEIALCTNPFELFLDYGLRIKTRSVAIQTFVVQLSGVVQLPGLQDYPGYLPTARAVAGGHHGALPTENWFGPEGGQALVEESVAAINALWA